MKIVTTCPITHCALYVSDIRPNLVKMGAKGDWGYSTDVKQAITLTPRQAMLAMKDMEANGRKPRFI